MTDIAEAIKLHPGREALRDKDLRGLALSCTLRLIQGIASILAVFLLVMTSSEVNEIILNFTAVNFISAMDENAFRLMAESGYYGSTLQFAANKVKETKVPNCGKKKLEHRVGCIFAVPVILLFGWGFVIRNQMDPNVWTTKIVRVQFDINGDNYDVLQVYNGCYQMNEAKKSHARYFYDSHVENEESASIGFCF